MWGPAWPTATIRPGCLAWTPFLWSFVPSHWPSSPCPHLPKRDSLLLPAHCPRHGGRRQTDHPRWTRLPAPPQAELGREPPTQRPLGLSGLHTATSLGLTHGQRPQTFARTTAVTGQGHDARLTTRNTGTKISEGPRQGGGADPEVTAGGGSQAQGDRDQGACPNTDTHTAWGQERLLLPGVHEFVGGTHQ